ncbi:Z-ring formation inhibitor MciZ [Siminovitchia sediminis]|uniref:Z-ring formation inhibitor MciZ n=1 Tax=Siminovitchia sediminis TaxID=1274353 RepID=A0ABW4KGM5_9BACI
MTVKVGKNCIVLTGKSWEVRALLKKYAKEHRTVQEWINTFHNR